MKKCGHGQMQHCRQRKGKKKIVPRNNQKANRNMFDDPKPYDAIDFHATITVGQFNQLRDNARKLYGDDSQNSLDKVIKLLIENSDWINEEHDHH